MTPELLTRSEAIWSAVVRGGPVLVVLVGISLLGLTIFLLKLYQFFRVRLWSRDGIDEALTALRAGDTRSALGRVASRPNPVARVVAAVVRGRIARVPDDLLREEVQRVGDVELAELGANLRGLETIGNLAPLLGLLGTVLGMIRAFMQLEQAGSRVDPAVLSGGIWEALLTTAVGLAIAIPVLGGLSWLESQIDRLRSRLSDAATQALGAGVIDGGSEVSSETAASTTAREPRHAI